MAGCHDEWRGGRRGAVRHAPPGTGRGERPQPAADRPGRVRAARAAARSGPPRCSNCSPTSTSPRRPPARPSCGRRTPAGSRRAGSGRETRWSLTPAGTELLREGTDADLLLRRRGAAVGRRWLVLTVGVPENNRALRQRLRTQLGWAGLGSPTPGVVGDAPGRPRAAGAQGARRSSACWPAAGRSWPPPGRSATSARWPARPGTSTTSSGGTRTSSTWSAAAGPRTDRQALVAQVRLVQEWRRFPLLDPGLPRELLPPRWTGSRAAEVFRERHAGWAPRAQPAWAELDRARTERGPLRPGRSATRARPGRRR